MSQIQDIVFDTTGIVGSFVASLIPSMAYSTKSSNAPPPQRNVMPQQMATPAHLCRYYKNPYREHFSETWFSSCEVSSFYTKEQGLLSHQLLNGENKYVDKQLLLSKGAGTTNDIIQNMTSWVHSNGGFFNPKLEIRKIFLSWLSWLAFYIWISGKPTRTGKKVARMRMCKLNRMIDMQSKRRSRHSLIFLLNSKVKMCVHTFVKNTTCRSSEDTFAFKRLWCTR